MRNEFVPYELALRMKHLGFSEPCFGYYNSKGLNYLHIKNSDELIEADYIKGNWCAAPLFQQAFRWFRESFRISGIPTHQSYEIWDVLEGECFIEVYPIESYEEAELACLTKLIEIAEQKQK